jgi:hypothetical protein
LHLAGSESVSEQRLSHENAQVSLLSSDAGTKPSRIEREVDVIA